MAGTPPNRELRHFSRLSPAVQLHQPFSPTRASNDPDLILLAGWMNASPRNLAKYTAGYERLYPGSNILAVTTSVGDVVYRTNTANLERVKPVLDVLYSLPPNAKVLLHFFSNGGAYTTVFIAKAYMEKMGIPLPASAMVMDSTPGRVTTEDTIRAVAVGLPRNPIAYFLGLVLLRVVLLLFRLFYIFTWQPNMIERIRTALNDKQLFSTKAPRTYIYSEGDDMVRWKDVEDHIGEAKSLGYPVSSERFGESGHAAHLLLDEGRYWQAVQRLYRCV